MTELTSPETTPWGWKALIIFCALGAVFMGIFWLAVSNEPDYMPSQQHKQDTQQHAFKNAPTMSAEALAEAQAQKQQHTANTHSMTAEQHGMSTEEHANMDQAATATHGHGH